MNDSKIYTLGPAAAEVFPLLNRITHNIVQHCGKIRYYGGGVHLDSRPFSMSMIPGKLYCAQSFGSLAQWHLLIYGRLGIFA